MSLIEELGGGDMRSIGASPQVVAKVRKQPERFAELIAAIVHDDPRVRMRAADAAEKLTREHPEWLQPHKQVLLAKISASRQQEVRWHLCQMLPRLTLTRGERDRAFRVCRSYLDDTSAIVRTCAMQAMHDLAQQDARLVPQTRALLQELTEAGTPAMRARGKKLLRALEDE
jgi:hypothetical protein